VRRRGGVLFRSGELERASNLAIRELTFFATLREKLGLRGSEGSAGVVRGRGYIVREWSGDGERMVEEARGHEEPLLCEGRRVME
jgi:hypothetical protein